MLGFEIASVCLKKLRRDSHAARGTVGRVRAVHSYVPIEIVEIDHTDTLGLAETLGLSSYDAAYLWLADKLAAELVTLDKQLQTAATNPTRATRSRKGMTLLW